MSELTLAASNVPKRDCDRLPPNSTHFVEIACLYFAGLTIAKIAAAPGFFLKITDVNSARAAH